MRVAVATALHHIYDVPEPMKVVERLHVQDAGTRMESGSEDVVAPSGSSALFLRLVRHANVFFRMLMRTVRGTWLRL